MNNNIINIALPAKGRLRENSLEIFKKKKLKIYSERGERDLFGYVKNHPEIKIIYLHAREAIESLSKVISILLFQDMIFLKRVRQTYKEI